MSDSNIVHFPAGSRKVHDGTYGRVGWMRRLRWRVARWLIGRDTAAVNVGKDTERSYLFVADERTHVYCSDCTNVTLIVPEELSQLRRY